MTEITLDRIIGAAAERQVAFTSETAGYLVLALVDALTGQTGNVLSEDLRLDSEGRVHVGRLTPCSSELMNKFLRGVLRDALAVAASPRAALVRLATQLRTDSTLAEFGRELETALIPVNRAAARRALARLHRDVTRWLDKARHEQAAQVEEQLREHVARSDVGPVVNARIEELIVQRDEAVAQQSGIAGSLCADGPSGAIGVGMPRFTSVPAHCTVLGRTRQHEAKLEEVPSSTDAEPSTSGTDRASAASQDDERTLALGFAQRRAATHVRERASVRSSSNHPSHRVLEQRWPPETTAWPEDDGECPVRGVPAVEQTAVLPPIQGLKTSVLRVDGTSAARQKSGCLLAPLRGAATPPRPSSYSRGFTPNPAFAARPASTAVQSKQLTAELMASGTSPAPKTAEHAVALPASSSSAPGLELAADRVLESGTTVERTVPLPVPVRSPASEPSPRRPNQIGPAEQAPIESFERTMALPIPTPRLATAWVEQKSEPSEDELPFRTSGRQLVVLESIEQTAALPALRRLEPALGELEVSDAGLETELELAAASQMCAAQNPSAMLESIERTLALPLRAPALEFAVAASDESIAASEVCGVHEAPTVLESIERTLALPLRAAALELAAAARDESIAASVAGAAAGADVEQELAPLADSSAQLCETAGDAERPVVTEVTMALPLVRRRHNASPRTEPSEPSTWELTAVDTVIEVADQEIQYVDVDLDIEGELQIDLAIEEETLVACRAAQTAQQVGLHAAPTPECVTHYGTDETTATIYSSIETLSDQFVIDPLWSEAELSRRLCVVAGIEPAGGLSRTPPPTETRSLEVQTAAQLEPTRKLRRTGATLGISAAVAALFLYGNVQKGAAVVAGATQPDALGQICRGTVKVSGVEPEYRLQIRQVGEGYFREPTRIVGTNATFSGLACGKDAELLVDGDRGDGVRRIPIPATRLQPVATQPRAVAELKLDGAS